MIRVFLAFCFSALTLSTPARAAWYEASGEHFIIYADQKGSTIQRFAERLEVYHAAMALLFGKAPETPSPSNRITVFVVSSEANVRKLADLKSRYAAGIYLPRAGNIVTIVPRLKTGGGKFELNPETLLRHEYAHHFMFNISNRAYPLWLQEGFAEFYASGRFERDGTIILGGVASHRAYELAASRKVPIELLLDTTAYRENKSGGYDQFYGRSWLLYHYLTFDHARRGQMDKYLTLLANGSTEIDAAREAYGDLDQLDDDLDRYAKSKRLTVFGIPPSKLKTTPVALRQLSDAESAIMPIIMESRTGVDEEEAKEVVVEARAIAAKYPDHPAVWEALAEAEFDAGYDAQAITAADRALALDPKRVRAQIQKIYAYARGAETADDQEAAWQTVRRQIVAANAIENNHPIPLVQYYLSYQSSGTRPPQIAIDGLQRALQIAPFDQSLRMIVSAQYMEDKQFAEAGATLRPVAFNPHGGSLTKTAQTLLELAEQSQKTQAAEEKIAAD
jgi:tetratricopeptide (TPR) repeat protein